MGLLFIMVGMVMTTIDKCILSIFCIGLPFQHYRQQKHIPVVYILILTIAEPGCLYWGEAHPEEGRLPSPPPVSRTPSRQTPLVGRLP